jgi:hypothetical protein
MRLWKGAPGTTYRDSTQRSHAATMYSCGQGRAKRTRCGRLHRRQHENEAILVYQDLFQMHVGRKKQELSGKHGIRFQWRITWRIGFVFFYDTTSRPFTESATESKVGRIIIIKNTGNSLCEEISTLPCSWSVSCGREGTKFLHERGKFTCFLIGLLGFGSSP